MIAFQIAADILVIPPLLMACGDDDGVGIGDDVTLGDGVRVGLGEGVGEGFTAVVGVGVGLGVEAGEGEYVGVGDGEGDAVAVMVYVWTVGTLALGIDMAGTAAVVGGTLGIFVGIIVTVTVDDAEGMPVAFVQMSV